MKKVLTKVLAGILGTALAVTAIAPAMAYVPETATSSDYQLRLVSIKAVDAQAGITGIRAYSDLVDTTKGYQVNDPIYLATTIEVLNREKSQYNTLKSIDGKEFKTIVTSDNIDLQFAKYTNPVLLSHIYSGINDTTLGTIANVLAINDVLEYDKDKNEISFKFEGYEQNAASVLTGFNVNASGSYYYVGASINDKKIMVPALRAKDGKSTVYLNNTTTYTYNWDAPASMAYTVVFVGITKNNDGAAEGKFDAKIQISGNDKFKDNGYYYVDYNGDAFGGTVEDHFKNDTNLTDTKTTPVEFVHYIKVPVQKMEIKDAYNVIRYDVKANGMINTSVPIIYSGDHKDYKDKAVGHVNPNKFDNTTKYDNALTDVETAGGVEKVKAITEVKYKGNGEYTVVKEENVPLSSVVYLNNYTVYAPTYYGIVEASQSNDETAYGATFSTGTATSTEKVSAIKEWTFNLKFSAKPNAANLNVTVIDAYTGKLVAGNQLANSPSGAKYYTRWVEDAADNTSGTLHVIPASSNVYPINSVAQSAGQQSWYVHLGTPLKNVDPGAQDATTYVSTLTDAQIVVAGDYVDAIFIASDQIVATDANYLSIEDLAPTSATPAAAASAYVLTGTNGRLQYASHILTAAPVSTVSAAYIPAYTPAYGPVNASAAPSAVTSSPAAAATPTTNWLTPTTGAYGKSTIYEGFATAPYLKGNVSGAGVKAGLASSLIPSHLTKGSAPAHLTVGPISSDDVTPVLQDMETLLTHDVVKVQLLDEWTNSGIGTSLQKATGKAIIPSQIPNFKIKSITVSWTPNQIFYPVGEAIQVKFNQDNEDFKKLNNTVVLTDTVNVTLTNPTVGNFAGTSIPGADQIGAASLSSNLYAGAYLTNSASTASDLKSPAYDIATSPLGITPSMTNVAFRNAGWAEKNTLPNVTETVSGSSTKLIKNLAYGYPNAKFEVHYTYGGGIYRQTTDPMSKYFSIVDNGDGHNGIAAYVIEYNSDEQSIITIATEKAYYDSTLDGRSIALFDAYNKANLSKRVYRSQDNTLTYAVGAGYVDKSENLISALRYFGLDTSFTTGSKVTKETFEAKAGDAVYSDKQEGTFKYGNLVLVDDQVDEGTVEETIDDTSVEPEDTDVIDDTSVEPDDSLPADTTPADTTPVAPKTADMSANVAMVMVMSAIVVAGALVFVLKKSR